MWLLGLKSLPHAWDVGCSEAKYLANERLRDSCVSLLEGLRRGEFIILKGSGVAGGR